MPAWVGAAHVVLVVGVGGLGRAGDEAAPERRVGDEADAQFVQPSCSSLGP
jgi:hypothetical protein